MERWSDLSKLSEGAKEATLAKEATKRRFARRILLRNLETSVGLSSVDGKRVNEIKVVGVLEFEKARDAHLASQAGKP